MRRDEVHDFTNVDLSTDQLRHRRREVQNMCCRRGDACGANSACELVAAPDDSADEVTVGAEDLPQSPYLDFQVVLFNDPVWPYPAHQFVLAEDRSGLFEECEEGVERPAAQ